MNDFTKEELSKLRDAWVNYDYCDDELESKIQSLIDNYCEHEYMTFLQDHNNEPFLEKCMKCHALKFLKVIE